MLNYLIQRWRCESKERRPSNSYQEITNNIWVTSQGCKVERSCAIFISACRNKFNGLLFGALKAYSAYGVLIINEIMLLRFWSSITCMERMQKKWMRGDDTCKTSVLPMFAAWNNTAISSLSLPSVISSMTLWPGNFCIYNGLLGSKQMTWLQTCMNVSKCCAVVPAISIQSTEYVPYRSPLDSITIITSCLLCVNGSQHTSLLSTNRDMKSMQNNNCVE